MSVEEGGLRFFEVADDYYFPLADGERFLWRSERGGWSDLFLYDHDGRLVRRLTESKLLVARRGEPAVRVRDGAAVLRRPPRDGPPVASASRGER